jgi:lupus La protein
MTDATKAFVKRQVEFYFGDSNLPGDKFMRQKANEDPDRPGDGQGWVELQLLCTFQRMRQKKGDMDDEAFVALAAGVLGDSSVVDVSDDGKRVRRATPLPNASSDEIQKRSFYAKGFPREGASLDDIMEFFEGAELGKVEAVRMRYTYDKPRKFKGSVFVEMSTEAEATAALSKSLSFRDTSLVLRAKAEYQEAKRQEYQERQAKKRKAEGDGGSAEGEGEGGDGAAAAATPKEHAKGTTLKVEGCGSATSRETLKEAFGAHGKISWVTYQRGEPDAFLFFDEAGKANEVIEKLFEAGVPEVGGKQPTISAVEGEEETEQWKKVWEAKAAMDARQKNGGGGGRGGRKHGGGGKRKRR